MAWAWAPCVDTQRMLGFLSVAGPLEMSSVAGDGDGVLHAGQCLSSGGGKTSYVLTPAPVMAGVLARERDARVVADERVRANTAMSLVRGDVVGGPVVRS